MSLPEFGDIRVAVVGLGYVGLPLAIAFAKHFPTLGFDINRERLEALRAGRDETLEIDGSELASSKLQYSSDPSALADYNFVIITVPTPIDTAYQPDKRPLYSASEAVGKVLQKNSVVVYESTVYPGLTEDECVPILQKFSGLQYNRDFFAGYSPERINPGDKQRTVEKILKITSGSTPEAALLIDSVYAKVISAGTFRAGSIRVAEAAKVIENTQRDVNIALMNELSVLFSKLGLDTLSVLEAAGTKWNFLPFRPGLVGGHCIGVDPYYLTYKAQQVGYLPEMILAGRRINDHMGQYIASRLVKSMIQVYGHLGSRKVLILGLTFKENCPDVRNTKIVDIVSELKDYGIAVDVHDPWANAHHAEQEYGLKLIEQPLENNYDAVILAVAHDCFKNLGIEKIRAWTRRGIVFDVKGVFPKNSADLRL